MKTDLTENSPVGSRTTEKHGDGGREETANSLDRKQKSILVIDTPKDCYDCPCYYEDRDMCNAFDKKAKADNGRPSWCPLSHPLKRVSNDFYIYDQKYLLDNLDREIDLLKGAKKFKEFMKAREEEGNNGKKPLPKDESHEYYGCPSCRHIVSSVQNYCENCGQKLDWRNVGETE